MTPPILPPVSREEHARVLRELAEARAAILRIHTAIERLGINRLGAKAVHRIAREALERVIPAR